jgi:hypothetical protein
MPKKNVLTSEEVEAIEAAHADPKTQEAGEKAAETIDQLAEEAEKRTPVPVLCGHVDMHSFGPDGKPDHPACELEPGHAGDHSAKHQQKVERERFYERETGKLLKIEYDVIETEIHWSDAAGVPAKDITPGKLPSRNKKSELMQTIEQLMA